MAREIPLQKVDPTTGFVYSVECLFEHRLIDYRHGYNCRTKGGVVVVDWLNYTGEMKFSRNTSYSVGSDGKLTVTTQEMTVSYSP